MIRSVVTLILCLSSAVLTQASELSDKLKSHEYVLLMRHTLAPGVGDPAGFTLTDCKTQRNLSAEGQKQAVAVGHWLRQQGVTSADVRTSTWCRCKDTAARLGYGGDKIEPSLNSFFNDMNQAKAVTQQLQKFIANHLKTKGEKALILVTHHVNIEDFTGEVIGSGDMVLTQVNPQGKVLSYKVIPRPD